MVPTFVFLLHSPMPDLSQMDRVEESLTRLHIKLDALLHALAQEDEQPPANTLDGQPAGAERDQTQSLG